MEVKSIYPIINFSDEDEIAVQYERLGYISGSHTEDLRILRKCFMQGQQVPGSRQQSRH